MDWTGLEAGPIFHGLSGNVSYLPNGNRYVNILPFSHSSYHSQILIIYNQMDITTPGRTPGAGAGIGVFPFSLAIIFVFLLTGSKNATKKL